jgi:hypothetical protein
LDGSRSREGISEDRPLKQRSELSEREQAKNLKEGHVL